MKSRQAPCLSHPSPTLSSHRTLPHLSNQIYVLADTTYNSLSVDEVAAAHVGADCAVHYGRASLTKLSRLPAFYVFPTQPLDVATVADALAASPFFTASEAAAAAPTVVLLDQPLLDALPEVERALTERLPAHAPSLVFANVPTRSAEPQQRRGCCGGGEAAACCDAGPGDPSSTPSPPQSDAAVAGYVWTLPATAAAASPEPVPPRFVWIGAADAPALQHLQLTHSAAAWLTADPGGTIFEGLPSETTRLLRRRRFLVEKARQANIVGLLVGTLGAAGYGDALRTLRRAAQAADKKTYTLLMGKPSPAKLANFPEIEVFVLVADPQGQILECRDYLAPVVTPHEAMLAFDPEGEYKWDEAAYRLDFDHVVAGEGGLNAGSEGDGGGGGGDAAALVAQAQRALVVTPAGPGGGHLVEARSAADYLVHKRSWKGVEAPLAGAEAKAPAAAVPGQSGRAAGYTHETGGG